MRQMKMTVFLHKQHGFQFDVVAFIYTWIQYTYNTFHSQGIIFTNVTLKIYIDSLSTILKGKYVTQDTFMEVVW